MKMEKDEVVSSFFTNISQVRYQLIRIVVRIGDDDTIQTIFDGIPSSWDTLLVVVNVK